MSFIFLSEIKKYPFPNISFYHFIGLNLDTSINQEVRNQVHALKIINVIQQDHA